MFLEAVHGLRIEVFQTCNVIPIERVKKLQSLLRSSSGSGEKKQEAAFPWKPLEDSKVLESLLEDRPRPCMIFKHSTRCGLSGMILRRFQQNWDHARDQADFYLLDLIRHRDLSDEIARRFEVSHQSPQVLILEGGRVRDHDSHGGINRLTPGSINKNPA